MLDTSDMQDESHAWFFSKLPFPVLRPYLRPVGVALLLGGGGGVQHRALASALALVMASLSFPLGQR